MSGIQVLLIGGVFAIFVYYLLSLRSAFIDLLAITLSSCIAIFFILFPEYTNVLAAKLGVGRGADLLFYLCILLFLFVVLKLYARIRRLEQTITDLVRQQANAEAVYFDNKSHQS
jgi:hypothetical protein